MARIRTLKPEFWTSEQVVDCSRNARLLMVGMLNFADDRGVLKFSARTIRGNVFPMDEDINSEVVLGLIRELLTNGLIGVFIHNDVEYIHILGFQKHQRVDKPNPKYPAPPKSPAGYKEWSANDLGTNGDLFQDQSPAEGKGREGSLREGNGRERDASDEVVERSPTIPGGGATEPLEPPSDPKPSATPRGTRIADDWTPAPATIAWAAKHGFGADSLPPIIEAFRDYWRAKAGRDAVKVDWQLTFQGWLRRESPAKSNGHSRGPALLEEVDPVQAKVNKWRLWLQSWVKHDGRWFAEAYQCDPPPSAEFFRKCPPDVAAEFGLTATPLTP